MKVRYIINFLRNFVCMLKLPFLALLSSNFSTICAHILSKYANKIAQKRSFFSSKSLIFILLCLCSVGCHPPKTDLVPTIKEPLHPKEMFRETRNLSMPSSSHFSFSPFAPLNENEEREAWGQEYRIGVAFASDFDLYRAITAFKRALILLPPEKVQRKLQIEYEIVLSYYLGKKYTEAIYQVESTDLFKVDSCFLAFNDLLLILYDSYEHLGCPVQAAHILNLISNEDPENGLKLSLLRKVMAVDLQGIEEIGVCDNQRSYLTTIVNNFRKQSLSIKKAEMLNALLPGAGYWYVGQKETAVTATVINGLFLAAAIHFLDHRNIPAAIITLSLESGWYFGGIWGAGLAAKTYNERLYENFADRIAAKEQYFPLMMLRYTF